MGPTWSFFKIIASGKASVRFFVAAILSFSFSIAVILGAIGLMDGFEKALKDSLQGASGDYYLYSQQKFFYDNELSTYLSNHRHSFVLEAQAFASSKGVNKGILLKGVDPDTFRDVSRFILNLEPGTVAIGSELAKTLGVGAGEKLTLTYSGLDVKSAGGAAQSEVIVGDIVTHGIYEKDLRFVYIQREQLARIFGYRPGVINKVLLAQNELGFERGLKLLEEKLSAPFKVSPYWAEYETLLKAVEVEKNTIGIILQIIVVIAVFNIIAFIIFIMEKKSQEFFLLRAFGASLGQLSGFWMSLLFFIWLASVGVSLVFTAIFNYSLQILPVFQLPGDVYVLSQLSLVLEADDYLMVFSLALLWIGMVGALTLWRIRQTSVLSGLRQEFK